jgi:hypothetical protein
VPVPCNTTWKSNNVNNLHYIHSFNNRFKIINNTTNCDSKPCDSEQSCDINSDVSCQCESCCVDLNKLELNLREKALKNPAFPDQEVGSCWYLREF